MLRYKTKETITDSLKYFDKVDKEGLICVAKNIKLDEDDIMEVILKIKYNNNAPKIESFVSNMETLESYVII